MRLIDADALIEQFKNADAEGINLALDRYAISCIDNAPTIDAVEVVRCKDCKHQLKRSGMSGCKILAGWTETDNRFCNYGERR